MVRGSRGARFSPTKGPGALARFLVNTLHGVRVLARTGMDQAVFDDSIRTALEVLRAPQKNPGRRG